MKQVLQLVSVLCLSCSFLEAQSPERTNTGSTGQQPSGNESKEIFIKKQQYLSERPGKIQSLSQNDSLQGFNEEQMRVELLSRGVYGSEYLGFIERQKRLFINQKYNLIVRPFTPPPTQNTSSGKPIGGPAFVNGLPCVNEDFEATAAGQYTSATGITGWTVESGMNSTTIFTPNPNYGAACNSNASNNWNPGSPELWVLNTPVLNVPSIGTLPTSPFGGIKVLKIQDTNPNGLMTRIKTSFPVTTSNALFQFAYAGSWDGAHECCGQPAFRIDMYQQNCTNGTPTLMPCSNVSLTPSSNQCVTTQTYLMNGTISYANWSVKVIDLTPYIGQCVTIVITCSDCSYGGHHGSAYFDAQCGGQLTTIPTPTATTPSSLAFGPVSFCNGSNQAIINGPLGYQTYSWVTSGATIPSSLATLPTLTITNPYAGQTFTLYLTTASGCQFVAVNTLTFTTVNIIGLQSGTTCPGGASGTATVVGHGSGTGYNYTWLNSQNQVVGTNSVATGLAAGVYSIVLTGMGAAGCGSAVATTTVVPGIPGIIDIAKPYCSGTVFLNMPGGSQYQWYNNTTPATNATNSTFTTTGINGGIVWLSYLKNGCKDSVRFTLYNAPSPQVAVKNISWICLNGTNGTAMVSMTPAIGALGGSNSFSIFSTGTTPPYNSSVAITSNTTYPLTNLAAGLYSVNAFDGSCYGGTTFSVAPYVFDFTLTASNPTLCPGNTSAVGVTVLQSPLFAQFSYVWTPNAFFPGSVNTYSSNIITPTIAAGTSTNIIYSVVATPAAVNCPLTRTLGITVIHPATPTITPIQNLCNTFPVIQVTATPSGGIFSPTGSGSALSPNGFLTPSLALQGVNTITYTTHTGPCVATQTANYEVSIFNTAALTATVPPLCVTSPGFNLMNIVQSAAGGTWSGQGVSNGTTLQPGLLNNQLSAGANPVSIVYNTVSSPNPSVCPDSSPLTVVITKTATPNITPIDEFCTNAAPFSMTVTPSGGTWISSYVTTQGLVNPQNAQTSVVNYTITDGPCVNTATIPLIVSQFVSAAITGTIPNQCAKGGTFNLTGIVQNQGGTWTGMGVTGSAFSPSLQTNTYTLEYSTLSFPNQTLCPDKKTIQVYVLNPAEPKISNSGPVCSNSGAIQLTVTPATGKWTPTPYLTTDGLFTPSLAIIGNNPVQYMIGTPSCYNTDTKNISVEAFVSAAISNQMPDQCSTNAPVNLQPFVLNAGSWTGAGISGNSFNPALVGAGTFEITHHTASSPSGLCPDKDVLSVNVFSIAAPQITNAGPFCSSHTPLQLVVTPVGGMFDAARPGLVSLGGQFNPAMAAIGDNLVNYTITSGPCKAYTQATINVEQFVSADLAKYMETICLDKNKINPVNLNSFVLYTGGQWSGPGVTGSMFDPFKANVGTNNVLIYTTPSKTSLCVDSSAMRVEIRDLPKVNALVDKAEACAPAEVFFNTPDANKGKGTWYFDDGTKSEGLSASHMFSTPGTYYATFSYKDEAGCEALPVKTKAIVINELPKAAFIMPDEILISDPQVQVSNESRVLTNNSYVWKMNGVNVSTELHPVLGFAVIGHYKVTLVASSNKGCVDEISKMIEVKNDFQVFVPTSFSPNFDGLNDVFIPVFTEFGLDEKSFELEIFDRWGHSVFYTTDRQKGWDGTKNRGEPVKQEVYVYKLRYKDHDGNAYNKIGDVTVLR